MVNVRNKSDTENLKSKAESGDLEAQIAMAVLYDLGLGEFSEDPKAAFQWWQQAADQGDGWAALNLGQMYEKGRGTEANPELAKKWKSKAEEQGMLEPSKRYKEMHDEMEAIENEASLDPNAAKILVVDDSMAIRMRAKNCLLKMKCRAILAEDGADAWRQLTSHPDIQLVITDIHMPKINGLDLLKKIKAEKLFANTPVVVLSNESSLDFIMEAKRAGIARWYIKPLTDEVIQEVITRFLPK